MTGEKDRYQIIPDHSVPDKLYRRHLGHEPLNEYFENSEEHHLHYSSSHEERNKDLTIYIPKQIHKSIFHSGKSGHNMALINKVALEWYLENTDVNTRNPKAIILYLKYCMLPEPVFEDIEKTPRVECRCGGFKHVAISLPDTLKKQVDEYNKSNPYNKISISRVVQAALHNKLVEMGKA